MLNKNILPVNGHPLIAYAIEAALGAAVFDHVIVSTDDADYARIAEYYGATVPSLRPAEFAGHASPDIEWVMHCLDDFERTSTDVDFIAILRPTNPFRTSETIRRAHRAFISANCVDSLRAVEPVQQHPGKMWVVTGALMHPFLPLSFENGVPWHSSQKSRLPKLFVQNASLEMAWVSAVKRTSSIAGETQMPFFTHGHEGFDINEPIDLEFMEFLLARGKAHLPPLSRQPFKTEIAT